MSFASNRRTTTDQEANVNDYIRRRAPPSFQGFQVTESVVEKQFCLILTNNFRFVRREQQRARQPQQRDRKHHHYPHHHHPQQQQQQQQQQQGAMPDVELSLDGLMRHSS
ncbi:unnamed protein product [Didymodactylos carnosus]|uniref:Uncharacterized protein n=1 Tax=Didymodactylos carnosus TaxID=1234261 RepID=A0A813PTD8_9BILA|nr:unnamed protein product [Didymodactylos carnosus]CAF3533239.1 unnamed protein product [Didymodactylos carnosus]